MNNIFDIKRFGQYFLYDLRNAKNNYGLSLLILGTLPISLFVIYELFSLIFTQHFVELPVAMKYMQFFAAITVVLLGAGTKIYGNLTEKKAGTNFLMLPASTFEKWLSMGLIVCFILPIVLFVLQLGSDALVSFLFPNHYGDRLLELIAVQEMNDTLIENGIRINWLGIILLEWSEYVLTFTLGAICFKKSKVAKTILCIFAISMVLSTIGMIIVGHSGTFYFNWFDEFDTATEAVRALNWTISIAFTVYVGGLLGGIYYRIRTLKH